MWRGPLAIVVDRGRGRQELAQSFSEILDEADVGPGDRQRWLRKCEAGAGALRLVERAAAGEAVHHECAGLGDEGGSGSWLAAAMKEFGQPKREELAKYEQFIDNVLWGGLQYNEGDKKFGVRKSLFYYQPDQFPAGFYRKDFDWTSWTSWNKAHAERVDRSFNYLHIVAAYWVLYHLARNYNRLVDDHPWNWYLTNAYETSVAMVRFAPEYAIFGQMDGDIFLDVLLDLRREGMNQPS